MGDFKKMKKAYEASSKIMEKRMEKERPLDLKILKKVKESSIIIVAGSYDKIEMVLDLIKVPYVLIQPHEFNQIELKPDPDPASTIRLFADIPVYAKIKETSFGVMI